jgi:hypothetical protein
VSLLLIEILNVLYAYKNILMTLTITQNAVYTRAYNVRSAELYIKSEQICVRIFPTYTLVYHMTLMKCIVLNVTFSKMSFFLATVIAYFRQSCNLVLKPEAPLVYIPWTMVLKESLAFYASHQSTVFCTILDASKAFDRLQYCKQFKMLISCQIPASITRVLINFYTGNFVRVQWCGVTTDYLLAINDVKQGSTCSEPRIVLRVH